MANPFTSQAGYVAAFPVTMKDDEWLVVLDRYKVERYSPERSKLRWVVRHSPSGKERGYPTKDMARISARHDADSVHSFDRWWAPSTP